ncbi:MAG: hypothetical protein HXS44_01480 [Theionarchaea archaeon]|nr:hypothetical protein [Theionarchaea archaeon]
MVETDNFYDPNGIACRHSWTTLQMVCRRIFLRTDSIEEFCEFLPE